MGRPRPEIAPLWAFYSAPWRAACKIAGVEPTTRELNDEDPTAFVLSANIHRRHMTKGQRAMAVAMIYPKAEKGARVKLGDGYYGWPEQGSFAAFVVTASAGHVPPLARARPTNAA